jgi:transposase
MDAGRHDFPNDIEALKAALAAERDRRIIAEAEAAVANADAAVAKAKLSDDAAQIAHLQLQIEKLKRELYGPRSERTARLLDQLELQLEELETAATEDEIAAEMAMARTSTNVGAFTRKRPSRKPFPDHLPRERVVIAAPSNCLCCGGLRLSKLGEDITETLEVIPRQWKVIQYVREKFSCRDCESISQAPAPFHVIARGWAGPSLLAMSRQMRSICPDCVREVWSTPAVEPSSRALRPGRRALEPLDPSRSGRRLRQRASSDLRSPSGLCLRRGTRPWR